MVSYIFGGDTLETPETIKRKRAIAQALLRGSNRQPESVGEAIGQGLSGLGDALIYRQMNGEADKAEKAGKDSVAADRAALYGDILPSPGAAAELSSTSPKGAAVDVSQNGDTFQPFIDTVKGGGLTNPYGLAAVAATGKAESGWLPDNAGRTWSDPSESGKPGMSGGILSLRGPRLDALQTYARSKGENGNGSTKTQAEYFLREDPQLVAKLNAAKSVEEAQTLMNNAWAFAGYDRPGGEAARRLGYASAYLPQFQGGGTEVASLDPSVGMGTASQAIDAVAPPSQEPLAIPYRDPTVSAPNSRSPVAAALASDAPAQAAPSGVAAALAAPAASAPLPTETQVASNRAVPRNGPAAQALAGDYFPPAPAAPGQAGPSVERAMRLLNNPYATEADRAMATDVIERARKQSDPVYQLDLETKRAQLDALKAKPEKQWQKLTDTLLFNPETGETKDVSGTPPGAKPAFRFTGSSVDAQALNGLMDAGTLSAAQAMELAAGKTITGPNGEIIFLTPSGIFSKPQNGDAQPVAPPATPAASVEPAGAPAAPAPTAAPVAPQAGLGNIPLTEPRVTIDESKAAGFADRMVEAEEALTKFGGAGASAWDQAVTDNPYIWDQAENWMVGDDFQQFAQARRNFINSQLRRESGAVISPEEFANANKQYFPMPGDSKAVLEQKAANRQTVINAMRRDAGPTYGKGKTEKPPAPTETPDFSKMSDEELQRFIDGK